MTDRQDSTTEPVGHRPLWPWVTPAVVVVVALVGVGLVLLARDSDVTTSTRGDGGEDAQEESDAGGPPPPGTYSYATAGSDGIDAFGGSENVYPGTTMISLSRDGECITTLWQPVVESYQEMTLCPGEGHSWYLTERTIFHSYFGQDEARTGSCDAAGYVPAPDSTRSFTWTCETEGSFRSGPSTEHGRGEVVGPERVTVEGVEHPALHVRYESEITGESVGSGTIDRWYALERYPLVVRETRSETSQTASVVGTVNFSKSYDLSLAAWEPQA